MYFGLTLPLSHSLAFGEFLSVFCSSGIYANLIKFPCRFWPERLEYEAPAGQGIPAMRSSIATPERMPRILVKFGPGILP